MPSMSTDPHVQDGAVPPGAAADAAGDAEASPPASPEEIYEQAIARLAVIIEEWQKARGALLGTDSRRTRR